MICRAFNKKTGPRPNDKIARSEMLFPVRDPQPLTFVSEMDLAAIPLRMQRLRPFSLGEWRPDSLRNVIAVCDPEVKGHTFMHRVGLNEPGTIGYSVAVTKNGIQKILVHREEYTFPEYRYWIRDEPEWCCWVYMPMNVGEHITQICASPSHMLNKDKSTGLTVSSISCSPPNTWQVAELVFFSSLLPTATELDISADGPRPIPLGLMRGS